MSSSVPAGEPSAPLTVALPPSAEPIDDLLDDPLLPSLPRVMLNGKRVPMLGGIPLLRLLGRGGVGAVYYGIDVSLGRPLAVKVRLRSGNKEKDAEMAERFKRGGIIAARLDHANLVSVLRMDSDKDLLFLVFQYIDGCDADACLKTAKGRGQQGLPLAEALEICIAATQGLAALHAEKVVHRDIKPQNIMIPRDRATGQLAFKAAKLADLDLARLEDDDALTQANASMGTKGYMAPEQWTDAREVNESSDVFSMGATLYALLAGAAPFSGSQASVLYATVHRPHPPLTTYRKDLPLPVLQVIDNCLAKDKSKRYQNGGALLYALEALRSGMARAPGTPGPARPGTPRWLVFSTITAAIAALVLIGVLFAQWSGKSGRPGAPGPTLAAAAPADPQPPVTAGPKREWPAWQARDTLAGYAQRAGLPAASSLDLGGGVKVELLLVPAGEFKMGSNDGARDELPAHSVRISRPYYVGKLPVTVGQFKRFVEQSQFVTHKEKAQVRYTFTITSMAGGELTKWIVDAAHNWRNPGFAQDDTHPVVMVTYSDAKAFMTWASKQTGRTVRLPTEAEWEYAARGPQSQVFPWGLAAAQSSVNHADKRLKESGAMAGCRCSDADDGFVYTAPAGRYKNASWCGALDMLGNARQWCEDWYNDRYFEDLAKTPGPAVDPKGPDYGEKRVVRGGGWWDPPFFAFTRLPQEPDPPLPVTGFRLCVEPPQ